MEVIAVVNLKGGVAKTTTVINTTAAEEALKKLDICVYPHVRRTNKVDDMTFAQEPLITSSPRSAAAKDYELFVHMLMGGK